MSGNKCKWKSVNQSDYNCSEPALSNGSCCILHSTDQEKEIELFKQKIHDRLSAKGVMDFRGVFFPDRFDSQYFQQHKTFFHECVDFSEAIFTEEIDFSKSKFLKKVNFTSVKFIKDVIFAGVEFRQDAKFASTKFQQDADFNDTKFHEKANFIMAGFSQNKKYYRNTTKLIVKGAVFRGAKFKGWTSFTATDFNYNASFNVAVFEKFTYFEYTQFKKMVDFDNAIFSGETYFGGVKFEVGVRFHFAKFRGEVFFWPFNPFNLTSSSSDANIYFGPRSSFQNANFLGETCFQEADLCNCSFVHSNVNTVDFRYCKFNERSEKLLYTFAHSRRNILKDELDADKGVEKNPKDKRLREEKYEPVRRIYLELKRNFEDKKDWNTAGDFHYGEMECRRKMKGILSLENIYFWLSGYGEKPLRALTSLVLLVVICSIFYMFYEGSTLKSSGYDSLKIAALLKLGKVAEPSSALAKIIFLIESIMGLTLIALLVLALRRKVKR